MSLVETTTGSAPWQGGPGGAAPMGLFANWSNGSPRNNGSRDCAGMFDDGTWEDRSCGNVQPFICER
jgi:hypothetical protein